jgi:anti-anti-sigma regulatory factor
MSEEKKYISYIDPAQNEWRVIVKADTLENRLKRGSLASDFEFAKQANLKVCIDLNHVEHISESDFYDLIMHYHDAKSMGLSLRYSTKNESLKIILHQCGVQDYNAPQSNTSLKPDKV